MADTKTPEIVTEKDLEPVLQNKTFDSITFLRLYNEWKVTKDSHTFSALRTMHQNAGYNQKNTLLGPVEQEMHEIAAIVQKYQDSKGTIVADAATARSAVVVNTATGPQSIDALKSDLDRELSEISPESFDKLKGAIEKAEFLITTYEKLKPQDKEGARGILGIMILERLSKAGYKVNIVNNNIDIISSKTENTARATQIETYLRSRTAMQENLVLGLIYRSSQFKSYSEVYLSDDKKSVTPNPRNYLEYLRDAQAAKSGVSLPQNDQDLERSRTAVESVLRDPEKVKRIILGSQFISQGLTSALDAPVASPAVLVPTTPRNQPVSAPVTLSGNTPPAKLPDWDKDPVNRTLAEIGQGFSGGISKLMSTPGAFGGLLIASIATWIFGDFKKGLMVFGAGFGLSGILDRLEKNGVLNGSGSAAPVAAPAPAIPSAAPIAAPALSPQFNENSISESQRAGVAKVRGNASLLEDIVNFPKKRKEQNATLDDYLRVVHMDSIQNITLDKIIYTTDVDQSIFSNQVVNLLPIKGDIPDNMSRYLLKRVLRTYIGVDQPLSPPAHNLKEGQITLGDFKKRFPEIEWKTKTLKELIAIIYKK